MPGARVVEIVPGGLRCEKAGEIVDLAADTVVLAAGTRSCNPLQAVAEEMAIPFRVVGDASAPGTVFEASHQGWQAWRDIA